MTEQVKIPRYGLVVAEQTKIPRRGLVVTEQKYSNGDLLLLSKSYQQVINTQRFNNCLITFGEKQTIPVGVLFNHSCCASLVLSRGPAERPLRNLTAVAGSAGGLGSGSVAAARLSAASAAGPPSSSFDNL